MMKPPFEPDEPGQGPAKQTNSEPRQYLNDGAAHSLPTQVKGPKLHLIDNDNHASSKQSKEPFDGDGAQEGRPPWKRRLPIEADDALRRKIPGAGVTLEHTIRLNDLHLAWRYDEEKHRVFGLQTPDQHIRDVIDLLLDVAITEMQFENATVSGVAYKMICAAVEACPPLRKQVLGPILFHVRSRDEVLAEIACISKILARLQEELELAESR
jgi:hypothetical protein